jgi:hypothetical protein
MAVDPRARPSKAKFTRPRTLQYLFHHLFEFIQWYLMIARQGDSFLVLHREQGKRGYERQEADEPHSFRQAYMHDS